MTRSTRVSRRLWLAMTLVSCRSDPPPEPPEPELAAAPSEPSPPCGPVGLRFLHLGWAPAELSSLAVIDLEHPELAAALAAVRSFVNDPRQEIPIDVAFAISQWSWQVPGLRTTLAGIGVRPSELAYVRTPAGIAAWVVPLQCDIDQAIARMQAAWRLEIRRTLSGVVASPSTNGAFAFDVVFLEGERIALAPVGSGATILEIFHAQDPGEPKRSAADALGQLGPAPVRAVARNHGLLGQAPDPSTPGRAGNAGVLRAFTADGAGVHEAAQP